MKAIKTEIPGVVLLEPEVFGDARGYFMERFSQRRFDELVGPVRFVQDNESKSRYGVVRGLHFQKGEYAQAKLVSVVRGRVLDVAVDIRRGLPNPVGDTSPCTSASIGREPSIMQATQVPLTLVGRPDSSIIEGLSTSTKPLSRISNTPISLVAP